MPEFEPVLLRRIVRNADPSLEAYRADGGYRALAKALNEMAPAQVTDVVKASGLRGRGGAGFPTGVKWTFLPKDHPGPIYMCINADESEPCTFNNRILMEQDPHEVLEGIIIACYAVKATTAYVYIRYEYGPATRAMQRAIDEAYSANLLGRNIQGKDFHLDVFIHRGAGAYICGEETGLIESLEGKRAWPRIKPPFPAVEGAFRKPTIVNNIETMACVPHIVERGADWFKSIGVPPDPKNPRDAGSYGPKLYCVSGHVNKPCCVELPLGVTVRELVDRHGGGVWKGRKAKGCIPGGLSMGLMTEAEFDTPLDFNGPGKVGCLGLGTAAVTVFDDQTSIVDVLYNICRFFAHESCGQCTPCREGTAWMLKIADRMRRGQGRLEDLKILDEVGNGMGIMPGTTICGLADGAGWPVKLAVRKFRAEFEEYLRGGKKSAAAPALAGAPLAASHRRLAMRHVLSRVLLAAVLVVSLSACGCPITKVREAAARTKRMNSIKIIGLAYHNYIDDNKGQAPQQAADLQKYTMGDPQANALLTDGSFVFVYGVTLTDMQKQQGSSQMVLGYDRAAETDKGIVLMGDASTQYVTADEFKKMPKAAPAKN